MNNTLFSASIRLDADPFTRPLDRARRAVRDFDRDSQRVTRSTHSFGRMTESVAQRAGGAWSRMLSTGRRMGDGFDRTLGSIERSIGRVGRAMKYNLIFGGIGLSAIFTGGISAGIKFNATMESNEIAFKTFLGSAKAAKEELKALYKIAATTPFEFPDVTDAARKFLSFGFTVQQTNKYLRTMADAAAATGASPEMMQRIVLAMGQMQAKGRVQGDELLQLTEAGIPALKILQKELGLTQKQMQNIGAEHISSEKAIPALIRGMDKLYGGASTAQAKTFLGMWSTFKDNANMTLGSITKGLFDASKRWLGSLGTFMGQVNKIFQGKGSMGDKFGKAWDLMTTKLNKWLDTGGEKAIHGFAEKFGQVFAGAINTVFGVGGGNGQKSPFYRMGASAVKGFVSGFVDNLKGGDILQSPLGVALTGYFGFKAWRKFGRKGGGGGGLPGVGGESAGVMNVTAGVVNVTGGLPGGVPGLPGGKGRPDMNPYPTKKPGETPRGGPQSEGGMNLLLKGLLPIWGAQTAGAMFPQIRDGKHWWSNASSNAWYNRSGMDLAKSGWNKLFGGSGNDKPHPFNNAAIGRGPKVNVPNATPPLFGGSTILHASQRNLSRVTAGLKQQSIRDLSRAGESAGVAFAQSLANAKVMAQITTSVTTVTDTLSSQMNALIANLNGNTAAGRPGRRHAGGTFRAPSRGGEGVAILRDGERVVPTSGSGRQGEDSRGGLNVHFHGPVNVRSDNDIERIASRLADKLEQAQANRSLVPVEG